MSILENDKIKKLFPYKGIIFLLAVEGLLVLSIILGMQKNHDIISVPLESLVVTGGSYQEEKAGYYIDKSSAYTGVFLETPALSLAKGVYELQVTYEADAAGKMAVVDTGIAYNNLLANAVNLFSGLTETDSNVWLLSGTDTFKLQFSYSGEGYLVIQDIQIKETNAGSRIALFFTLCLSLLINLIYIFIKRTKNKPVSKEKMLIGSLLFGLIFITCIPLMNNYMLNAHDLIFHLSRIEGLREGILEGELPVRIQPYWLNGNGYAASVFYGDLFLYIPAILRIIGFPAQAAYKIYVILINVATCLISYFCFSKMFKSRWIGLMGSVLYCLSIYRVFNLYIRAAVGEYSAITFLPLLAYGFYQVFTKDTKDASYKKSWIPLVFGFTGIIQTHILTCEMVAVFVIVLCLVMWKRILKLDVFLELLKTVVITLLVNLWFLVPFLDYMINGDYQIVSGASVPIQKSGLLITHLLTTFFQAGTTIDFTNTGMIASEPVGPGITLVAAIGIFLYLLYTGHYKKNDQPMLKTGFVVMFLGCLALFMTLRIFPWNQIFAFNHITMRLVSSIQFPWRFLSIGTICLVVLAQIVMSVILGWDNKAIARGFYAGFIAMTILTSVMLMNDILYVREYIQLYNKESMGSGNVGGGEYLPTGTDLLLLAYNKNTAGNEVTIEEYKRAESQMMLTCNHTGTVDSFVEVSLLYYKGYQAKDMNTGELLQVKSGNNNQVRIILPAGYKGTFCVSFVSPGYWRAAEVVSLITILLCIILIGTKNLKKGDRAHEMETSSRHQQVEGI